MLNNYALFKMNNKKKNWWPELECRCKNWLIYISLILKSHGTLQLIM